MAIGEIYCGGFFNIAQAGDDWAIWRICDDEGNREQIVLTRDGMDSLRDYFADYYAEDRDKATVKREEGS